MKSWIGEIIRIIMTIAFAFVVVVIATRMHAYVAVLITVIVYVVYALCVIWTERFDDDYWL